MGFSMKEFVEQAQSLTSNQRSVAVLVKEFLHYDILRALSESGMGRELVFQGGTALRICHGGERLSEDLDFVCGRSHEAFETEAFFNLLRESVGDHYGVKVDNIKSPERDLSDPQNIGVKWWEFHLKFEDMGRVEKIRLEVCNVPSYDAQYELIRPRHPHLADIMPPFMMRVESKEEILADKLVALGLRKFLKARDIWDVKFLKDQGVKPDYLLVAQKVQDYQKTDPEYLERLEANMALLRAGEARANFITEMTRFVDLPMAQVFEQQPAAADTWLRTTYRELRSVQENYLEAAAGRDAGRFASRSLEDLSRDDW